MLSLEVSDNNQNDNVRNSNTLREDTVVGCGAANSGMIDLQELDRQQLHHYEINNHNINNNNGKGNKIFMKSRSLSVSESRGGDHVKLQIQPDHNSVHVQISGANSHNINNRKNNDTTATLKREPSLRERFSFQNLVQRLARNRLNRSKSTTSALPVAPVKKSSSDYTSRRQSSVSKKSAGDVAVGPSSCVMSSSHNLCPDSRSYIVDHMETGGNLDACPICYEQLSYHHHQQVDPSTSSKDEEDYSHEHASNLAVTFSDCRHAACLHCWCSYVVSLIENYQMTKMSCMICKESLHFHQLVNVLKLSSSVLQHSDPDYANKLVQRYDNFLLYRALAMEPHLRWCPSGGCGYAVIAQDCDACPELFCERIGCQTVFCYRCRGFWHANSCKDNSRLGGGISDSRERHRSRGGGWAPSVWFRRRTGREDRSVGDLSNRKLKKKSKTKQLRTDLFTQESSSDNPGINSQRFDDVSITKIEEDFDSTINSESSHKNEKRHTIPTLDSVTSPEGDIKRCPRCHSYVLKMDDGTCNHMVCIVCGCEFCWLCMKEITDMHYLSPSGCTFWGRKQWTVEKRILWQLGTLLGAPIGVGFLAAIAVPAIIIGIPIYTALHIKKKYKSGNKHKRRLAVICGAISAFLLSPIAAGLTVGLGVPLMMAYVYIVMPMALCRASFCAHCEPQNIDSDSIDLDLANDNKSDDKVGGDAGMVDAETTTNNNTETVAATLPESRNIRIVDNSIHHQLDESGPHEIMNSFSSSRINCTTSERNVLKVTADVVHSSEPQGASAPTITQLESGSIKNFELLKCSSEDLYSKHSSIHHNYLTDLNKFGIKSGPALSGCKLSSPAEQMFSHPRQYSLTWPLLAPRASRHPTTTTTINHHRFAPPFSELGCAPPAECPPTPYTHLQYCPLLGQGESPPHSELDYIGPVSLPEPNCNDISYIKPIFTSPDSSLPFSSSFVRAMQDNGAHHLSGQVVDLSSTHDEDHQCRSVSVNDNEETGDPASVV